MLHMCWRSEATRKHGRFGGSGGGDALRLLYVTVEQRGVVGGGLPLVITSYQVRNYLVPGTVRRSEKGGRDRSPQLSAVRRRANVRLLQGSGGGGSGDAIRRRFPFRKLTSGEPSAIHTARRDKRWEVGGTYC